MSGDADSEATAPFVGNHDVRGVADLVIVGGGVNGCGIARDAAGRGASVVLFEKGDLAQGTSSASTKLIHGGLRYLEYYEFRLVRESLQEREVLWAMAPHIVRPLRFVLPHHDGLRPAWLLRLGLWLYDHLGGRERLPAARAIDLRRDAAGSPLKTGYVRGFEYSDCWVDDARLVVLNAVDAAERGASIRTRTTVTDAERVDGVWRVSFEREDGSRGTVGAHALVNAAGPWVATSLRGRGAAQASEGRAAVRLVQGSHIVTRRLFSHDRAYIFQNQDGRIVFAIPYERDFTLIGTTDSDYTGDPGAVAASEEDIAYLCGAASSYFRDPVERSEVVWAYSGVRPLYDDGASSAQAATRDYVLKVEAVDGRAPLLSVFGGKITTYRRLAEAAMRDLIPFLPVLDRPSWTATSRLPGGDFSRSVADEIGAILREKPWLPADRAERYLRAYGTRTARMLGGAAAIGDLGQDFGGGLTEREVAYLMDAEWAQTPEDVLWRRSKLGLAIGAEGRAALAGFMSARRASMGSAK